MATYKGFSTIGKLKKFSLVDYDLVKRDLINAFMTREGEVSGRPDLGTKIWTYVFEQNTVDVRKEIDKEVRRIIAGDSRLTLVSLNLSYNHNTVIVEVELILKPNYEPQKLALKFDRDTEQLYLV